MSRSANWFDAWHINGANLNASLSTFLESTFRIESPFVGSWPMRACFLLDVFDCDVREGRIGFLFI